MARLLIASRSMALALRLADAHEIVEHSPDALADLQPSDDVDAVVLDVGEASAAVDAVRRLRGLGYETPVLLVSGYAQEWEGVAAMGLPGVHVVPLPITRVALLQGVGYLTGTVVDLATIPETPHGGLGADSGTTPVSTVPTPDDAPGEPAQDAGSGPDGDGQPDGHDGTGAEDEPEETVDDEPGLPAAGAASLPIVTGRDDAAPAIPAPTEPQSPPQGAPAPWSSEAPVPSEPGAHSPPWGTPVADAGDWGPAPHLPPSTTHPLATVPPTPIGGIRRPGEPGTPGPVRPGRGATLEPRETREPEAPPEPRDPPTGGLGVSRRRPLLSGRRGRGLRPTVSGRADTGATPAAAPPAPAAAPQPEPEPYRDPTPSDELDPLLFGAPPEPDPLASALEQRLDAQAAAGALGVAGGQPPTPELVRMLLERMTELYGVGDTAQVLADDVVERADADAAAVLVPDGGVWRVSAGVGLRPLERRLVLDPTHWMISEIADPGRAVLIEDTDIVRQQLAGAPLAAWRHILAVPVPEVRAAVVLARGQEAGPFTDRDLTAVVPTVREASTLLSQAIEVRDLARRLAHLRDRET
jgi:hypothetical protein